MTEATWIRLEAIGLDGGRPCVTMGSKIGRCPSPWSKLRKNTCALPHSSSSSAHIAQPEIVKLANDLVASGTRDFDVGASLQDYFE